ncbi:MAG: hypothetical protein U0X39_03790 [Bacteroidales bacterium]
MDCPIFEEAEAKLMLPYTGKPPAQACRSSSSLQSGGGFEIWQYKERTLRAPQNIIHGQYRDLCLQDKSEEYRRKTIEAFTNNGTTIYGVSDHDPDGEKTLFLKDPFGNIFQLVEAYDWFMNEKKLTGGAYGAIVEYRTSEKSRSGDIRLSGGL